MVKKVSLLVTESSKGRRSHLASDLLDFIKVKIGDHCRPGIEPVCMDILSRMKIIFVITLQKKNLHFT